MEAKNVLLCHKKETVTHKNVQSYVKIMLAKYFEHIFSGLQDCKWKPWGKYGKCSAICDGGYQSRSRGKTGPFYGGKACKGSSTSRKACGKTPCWKGLFVIFSDFVLLILFLSVTNCGDLAVVYAKTKAKLTGEIKQRNRNLVAYNGELKLAKDEVRDGEELLKVVNTRMSV